MRISEAQCCNAVEVSDTTMMIVVQMPVTKFI
jgi:hypothetical protein